MIDLSKHNYVLTRLDDNLQIPCEKIGYIEWDENKHFVALHDEPAIGRSIIADPHRLSYSWCTTRITEIISDNKFKTKNSTYTLHKV